MNGRDSILNRIRNNKPKNPLTTRIFEQEIEISTEELKELFTAKLEKSGAVVQPISTDGLKKELETYAAQENAVIEIPSFQYEESKISSTSGTKQLNLINIAILEAQLGVAENGAIWIDETVLPHRAVPFITQDLILVVSGERIVANMHEAYKVIDIAATGYGLFIAGPSKTADIEQSLVIGAHGAKSLKVFIY